MVTKKENEEYLILRGVFSPTKPQLMRLNELREIMGQKDTGFFEMSLDEKCKVMALDAIEVEKRATIYKKYKKSSKPIPGEKTYNPECPSFGEE